MDVATLYVSGALVGAIVAAAIWLGNGGASRHNGLALLLLASLVLAAALALFGLRGMVGDWMSQGVGNSLLLASALLYRVAVDQLYDRREWSRVPFAVLGVALLAVWGAIVAGTPDVVRTAVCSLAVAAVLSLPAWALLTGAESWRGRSRYLAGGAFTLGALVALARGLAVIGGAAPVSLVDAAPINLALAAAIVAMVTVGSFSFLVLLREREHARLAMLDELTEVLNRRAFMDRAEAVLSLARRRDLTCSVVLVDLDRFNAINDAHGYAAGDQVLRHFANVTRGVLRREDVLGRYGGDEFVMLLFATPAAGGEAVGHRIMNAIASHPPRIRQLGVPVTGSFGVAEWMHGSETRLEELLHRADRSRFEAKARGRNCIVRYDQLAP